MFDVVREILLCLLVAALLGAAIGWLARGLRGWRLAAAERSVLQRSLAELRAQLSVNNSARAGEQRELGELQTSAASAARQGFSPGPTRS